MEKLKVIDFDYGCGGFSKGLEDTGFFEVVYNGSINEKNKLCYNNVHKNNFSELDIMPRDIDLAVFVPNFGFGKDFSDKELNNFTALVSINDFPNLIFLTAREVIPFLQKSKKVCKTSDNYPTKDIICYRLLDLGYNVFNFILDGAGFGLPQHKFYNIYWASKDIKESIFIKDGFGLYKRPYRKVQHLIGDIRDDSDLTWHTPNYKKRYECSLVRPGSCASKTDDLPYSNKYIRLDADSVCSSLRYDFYNVSSSGPSINPWYDRPLTIREGARLFGLTDDFTWDSNLSKRDVGLMIHESFPPVISGLLGQKIVKFIKKNMSSF